MAENPKKPLRPSKDKRGLWPVILYYMRKAANKKRRAS